MYPRITAWNQFYICNFTQIKILEIFAKNATVNCTIAEKIETKSLNKCSPVYNSPEKDEGDRSLGSWISVFNLFIAYKFVSFFIHI